MITLSSCVCVGAVVLHREQPTCILAAELGSIAAIVSRAALAPEAGLQSDALMRCSIAPVNTAGIGLCSGARRSEFGAAFEAFCERVG